MLFIASSAVSVTLLYITSMYCFISADTSAMVSDDA